MSSKCPKFTTNTTRTKMFNVEKKVTNYKPRFYTNKNLFFVRNIKKNNAKLHKKKFKLKFIKNRQNALVRRELRYKHGLFITHHNKVAINSNGETSPNKLNKLKRKLKFKFSVINQTQIQDLKINKNIENTTDFFSNEEIISKNILNEDIKNNSCNNNTPIKKQKIIINKNSKYSSGRWNLDEHKKFIEAIIKFGNDWKKVQKHIGTRSSSQARSHAQKFFIKLKQDQSKSKISNMIDYSNSSIKAFHDALQALTPDKKSKIIQELESVVFDKQISNKKRRRNKNIGMGNYSESITEMGFVSGTEFFDDETFILENKKDDRKMSLDSLSEEKLMDKRKFIHEMENNINGIFTDEEYEKSFHKVFSDVEGKDIEVESRKQSIEDDFIFNNIKI